MLCIISLIWAFALAAPHYMIEDRKLKLLELQMNIDIRHQELQIEQQKVYLDIIKLQYKDRHDI